MILARFAALLAVTFFLSRTLPLYYSNQWIMLFLGLPGTILLEGAHWFAALLLQGNPSTFSILPTFDGYGNMQTLGHIEFHPNWYNAATVSLAPFLLMPLTFFIAALSARTLNPIWIFFGLWFAAAGWLASTPSPQDFSIANSAPISWLIALPLLLCASYVTYLVTRRTLKL